MTWVHLIGQLLELQAKSVERLVEAKICASDLSQTLAEWLFLDLQLFSQTYQTCPHPSHKMLYFAVHNVIELIAVWRSLISDKNATPPPPIIFDLQWQHLMIIFVFSFLRTKCQLYV